MRLSSLTERVDKALTRRFPLYEHWRSPYWVTLRFLARSDEWDAQTVRVWQERELDSIVQYALRHVQGHARKFRAAGFCGRANLQDLSKLPFFTKDELRATPQQFVSDEFDGRSLREITTGGSTGTPTRFAVESERYDSIFDAWRHAMWRRGGFTAGVPSLDLTWAFEEGAPLREGRDNTFLSIHELSPDRLSRWVDRVIAMKPEFIIGFPSTASALAGLLPLDVLPEVRGVLLASEPLSVSQREVIETAFPNAKIFCWYGMSELAGFASYCEHSDEFHHWPQSGILEIVNEAGESLTAPGSHGEIVLTGFLNRATPFIRYRTGDCATLGDMCPKCRRPHVILAAIDGRVSDFLLSRRQRVVPLSALNFHSNEFRNVFAHQFVQDVPGEVALRLVPLSSFRESDAECVRKLVTERLGPDFRLTVEKVGQIDRTVRGKHLLIVQRATTSGNAARLS